MRLLPRVQAQRQQLEADGTPVHIANQYLNCGECTIDPYARRLWHCGWIPNSRWIDDPTRPFAELGANVCPGYTTTLPEVIEASRLLVWANRGELRSYIGERREDDDTIAPLPAVAGDAIDIMDGEVKAVEREILHKARQDSGK